MSALLILAHAPLATALRDVAAHVYPQCNARLVAVDVQPQWSIEDAEQAGRSAIAGLQPSQVLILCDVFGATPANAAQRMASGPDMRLLCGVNVPMLWRALCYLDEPVDALLERAAAGGVRGVLQVGSASPQNQTLNVSPNDQDHSRHQQ